MFKVKRVFGTAEAMKELEEKINKSKNVDEALKCIPCNYPGYIVDELNKDIKFYFKEKKDG